MQMRGLVTTALASALWSACWAVAAGPAEFALRWDTAQGGPTRIAEVVTALQLQAAKGKRYEVRYFDVVQALPVPAGYQVLGRERGAPGSKPDATYKVRGPEPMPPELLTWKCPLTGPSESKREVDVGFVGLAQVKRSFSVSCTVDKARLKASLPAGNSATPRGCTSAMERTKASSSTLDVKVEQWSLPQGRVVIEVSMEGSDSKVDLERFRDKVVMPLLDRKAIPLEGSKTELGSDC